VSVFEDNFAFLSGKWKIIGTHPNFTVDAVDGWLKFTMGWAIPPETPHESPTTKYPYNTAGVCYDEPIDLTNTKITVKVDMERKDVLPYYPGLQWWNMGLMIANKRLPRGADLLSDPEFKAALVLMEYISGYPAEAIYYRITGYTYSEAAGKTLSRFPPTELSMEVTPSSITFLESDLPLGYFVPPFDISKSYIYLLAPKTAEVSKYGVQLLCPTGFSFDYVKVEKLPPPPMTAAINTTLYTTLAMCVLISNTTLLMRGAKLLRGW